MSLHSFDTEVAAQVGLNAAVIYQNILFWAEKNKANNRHIHDGLVFTYNSRRAFSELFPYLSESQIKTALSKLIDGGLVIKGEFNNANYDRTNWYAPAISAEWVGLAIGQKSPMDWSESTNGLVKNHQPIPVSKPYGNPDSKKDTNVSQKKPTDPVEDAFVEFWERYPKKVGKPKALSAFKAAAKKHGTEAIIFGLSQHLPALENADPQFRPHPTTWINQERYNDEPEQPSNHNGNKNTRGASTPYDADGTTALALQRILGQTQSGGNGFS